MINRHVESENPDQCVRCRRRDIGRCPGAGQLSELVAYLKPIPGKVTYARGGDGSAMHLAGKMQRDGTNRSLRHAGGLRYADPR